MPRSCQHEAVPHVFPRRPVIARRERMQGIAHAVDVIEELAHGASPSLGARQRVMRNETQPWQIALQLERHGIVAGPVIALVHIHVRHHETLQGIIRSQLRRKQVHASRKRIRPVGMRAILMRPVRAQGPVLAEGMLHAGARVQCIRGSVMRIDHGSLPALSRSR